jgi:hypothetical protein
LNLVGKRLQVDDRSGTDDVDDAWIEDSGRHQTERELAAIVDDGVAGVVAALIPNDTVRIFREVIDHAAFAFVAPVSADYDPNGHPLSFEAHIFTGSLMADNAGGLFRPNAHTEVV